MLDLEPWIGRKSHVGRLADELIKSEFDNRDRVDIIILCKADYSVLCILQLGERGVKNGCNGRKSRVINSGAFLGLAR